jgi:hypothetical protein
MSEIPGKRDDELSEIDWIALENTRLKSSRAEESKQIHPDLNIYSSPINIYVEPC